MTREKKERDHANFVFTFVIVNIFVIYTLFIIIILQAYAWMKHGRTFEATLMLTFTGFILAIYILLVRDRLREADKQALKRLNEYTRLSMYGRGIIGATNIGIVSKVERRIPAWLVMDFLKQKGWEEKYQKVKKWLVEHDLAGPGSVEQALLQDIADDAGTGKEIVLRGRVNPERIPYDKIPIEHTLLREFDSHFTKDEVSIILPALVAMSSEKAGMEKEIDLIDKFIALDRGALEALVKAGMKRTVEDLVTIQGYLEHSLDFFTRDEVDFFKKHQIYNVKELRGRMEMKELEDRYNAQFLQIRGKKLEEYEAQIQALQAPAASGMKGRLEKLVKRMRAVIMAREKEKAIKRINLRELIETHLINEIIDRESKYHLTITTDERAQIFNVMYTKNIIAPWPDMRSYVIEGDREFMQEYETGSGDDIEIHRVPVSKFHLITQGSYDDTIVADAMPTRWEGRSNMICQQMGTANVHFLFWFREREPVYIVTYSDWPERYIDGVVQSLRAAEMFEAITQDYVKTIQEQEQKHEELKKENDEKDKALQQEKISRAKEALIRKSMEDVGAFNKRLNKDWRLYKLPAGWIVFVIAVIVMFSILSFLIGKYTGR
ncbi:MAG: hypothetical protein Q6365_008765 [Candidatus Sigynarchaeota archaeon]